MIANYLDLAGYAMENGSLVYRRFVLQKYA